MLDTLTEIAVAFEDGLGLEVLMISGIPAEHDGSVASWL
jgi:hypothetical protein